jgi:hypothetical protein
LSSGSGTEWSGVRRRRLLQIGGRTRRAEREMAGGSARACHTAERKWEREREGPGHGGRQREAIDVAGNGPRPSGSDGGTVAQIGESRRAWAMRCCAVDRWSRAATGPGGQRWGVGGREKTEAARRRGTNRQARPVQCRGAV